MEDNKVSALPQPPPYDNQDKDIEKNGNKQTVERGEWGSPIEFILTIVGYAVGLGNVWRFPYLCYRNGGGAFLLPYFLMLALIGIPIFYLEIAFGQFSSLGPISVWEINPMLKGLGYSMGIVNLIMALYYDVIICWALYYFFASMTSQLPWEFCGNWWNTDNCFEKQFLSENCTRSNYSISCSDGRMVNNTDIKTPSEEYFYNQVLRITPGIDTPGGMRWELAGCLLVTWLVIFFVLVKGIQSLGKVVYFSSLFPYVLLSIMFVRGVTLPGASTGLAYYLKPDFAKLSEARVWSEAATQIFYSLSACTGGLIAMASYNKFNNNCFRDSILVPCINCGTSFFAGFVIFSVLGFMAHEKGVSVDDVAEGGPGLVFVVYPEGLTQMPLPPLWSILFFLMLVTLGFSSEFSMCECFFSSIIDEFPRLRNFRPNIIFRGICVLIFYLITLPMVTEGGFYLFNLVDVFLGGFPLLYVGLFELIGIIYIYGYSNFAEDIYLMIGNKPNILFKICWNVISPILILAIIISATVQYSLPKVFGVYTYPVWAYVLGWLIVVTSVICIPGVFIYRLLVDGGIKIIKASSKPTSHWGPSNPADRKGRYALQGESNLDEYNTKHDALPNSGSNGQAVTSRTSAMTITTNETEPSSVEKTCTKDGESNPGFEMDRDTSLQTTSHL